MPTFCLKLDDSPGSRLAQAKDNATVDTRTNNAATLLPVAILIAGSLLRDPHDLAFAGNFSDRVGPAVGDIGARCRKGAIIYRLFAGVLVLLVQPTDLRGFVGSAYVLRYILPQTLPMVDLAATLESCP